MASLVCLPPSWFLLYHTDIPASSSLAEIDNQHEATDVGNFEIIIVQTVVKQNKNKITQNDFKYNLCADKLISQNPVQILFVPYINLYVF